MNGRRWFLKFGIATSAVCLVGRSGGQKLDSGILVPPKRLVFVHGRSQQGKDPEKLKAIWVDALKRGAESIERGLPDGLEIAFPYYGDALDAFARQLDLPTTADIQSKGSEVNPEFLAFQAEVADELRRGAGITDAQIDAEYGPNPKAKGPQNWEWVQAILRALDKNAKGFSQATLEEFTRDVFLYTRRTVVQGEIDEIVAREITEEPTVVVGHSLGSVVAYNVLRSDARPLDVPLYLTVGSPLGIRAIRNAFRPIAFPGPVRTWYNAFDERDIVALYPLDASNFAVTPAIENYSEIRNHTNNRHGIGGYLDDRNVARTVLDSLDS